MRRVGLMTVLAVGLAMVGVGVAGVASAAPGCTHRFGSHQQVADGGGVQDWSVTDLKASTDPVPGYPLAGRLWEATATVTAVSGAVTPLIPNFSAPTADGGHYAVLWQVASLHGIPAVTLAPGQASTGTIYFDVTGGDPVAVTYAAGSPQALTWCCSASMRAMPMSNCSCAAAPQCSCGAGKN